LCHENTDFFFFLVGAVLSSDGVAACFPIVNFFRLCRRGISPFPSFLFDSLRHGLSVYITRSQARRVIAVLTNVFFGSRDAVVALRRVPVVDEPRLCYWTRDRYAEGL